MKSEDSPKQVIMSYIKSLNEGDFKMARTYVSDDLTFQGPLASRQGAEVYFNEMKQMRLKYDIKKVFVEEDDVCVLYDFSMGTLTLFGCGWYHIENGKIKSFRVIFDPRPLIESST